MRGLQEEDNTDFYCSQSDRPLAAIKSVLCATERVVEHNVAEHRRPCLGSPSVV